MDDRQYRMPFGTTPAEVARLRSIDFRVTGFSDRVWMQCREILIVVYYHGLRDQCEARPETLLAKANDNSRCEPMSMATFKRRQKDLVDLGLLVVERRYRRTSVRTIDWQAVDKLLKMSRQPDCAEGDLEVRQNCAEGELEVRWNCAEGEPTTTHINPNQPKVDRGDQKEIEDKPLDLDQVRRRRRRIQKKLGLRSPLSAADRELIAKVALLAARWGEDWLEDALEAVVRVRPGNPVGYWRTCLDEKCRRQGRSLAGELFRTTVPAELAQPEPAPVDLSDRLCEGGSIDG